MSEPDSRSAPGRSIAAGGAQSLGFRVLEVAGQLGLLTITARLMEPSGRGLYALASLAATICSLVLGSVWTANAIELAKGRTNAQELRGASVVIAVVGGGLIACAGIAFSLALGDRWWVVAFPAATTPFLLMSRYQQGLLQSLGRVRPVNLIMVSRVLIPLLFITPALLAGIDDQGAIGIWALSLVVVPLLPLVMLHRQLGPARIPRDRALYRRLVSVGLRLAPSAAPQQLNVRIGLIALAIFTTEAAVGVFSVATAVAELLLFPAVALSISSFRRIADDERAGSAELTARSVRHAVLLSLAGAMLLVPASALALPWVIGAGYGDVPVLVALLAVGMAFRAALIPLYAFVSVQAERPGTVTVIAMASTALTVFATFALVPIADAEGAAIASSVAAAASGLATFRVYSRESGERARVFIPGPAELRDYVTLWAAARAWMREGRRRGRV